MAKLIITLDGAQVGEVVVDKERITIGRRPENDIQLDHIAVSSQHAAIVSILNDSFLEDLGSTNGTVVNGGAVHKHFLRNGDLIEIGRHRLRYIGDVAATREPSDFEKTMVLNRPAARAASHAAMSSVSKAPSHVIAEADGALPAHAERAVAEAVAVASPLEAAESHEMFGAAALPADPEMAVAALLAQAGTAHAGSPQAVEGARTATEPAPSQPATIQRHVEPVTPVTAPKPAAGGHAPLAFLQILNGTGAGRVLEINKPLTTVGRQTVQVAVISRRSSGYFVAQVDGDEPARINNAPLPANAIALHVHDILEIAGIKLEFFLQD